MDVGRHPNIKVFTYSDVIGLEGEAGNFIAKIKVHPRYVNMNECIACGDCSEVCPIIIPDEFDEGLSVRKAIYIPFAQAVPASYIIDMENCLGNTPIACGKCSEKCEKNCIDYDQLEREIELNVGSVIIATGIDVFDPRTSSEFGYTRYENIVTSMEFERLVTSGGPSDGQLIRLTDRKIPKSIAFIQCVGSRNMNRDINYCSRICCMNTIKDTLVLKESYPNIDVTVFYIDIRAFGKGFEEFYNRSLKKGVKYIKGKPSKIVEDKEKRLIIYFENEKGECDEKTFDMVCLSSALLPSGGCKDLSDILGLETDEDGFFKTLEPSIKPLESTKEGVFLCGCSTGPKDITDSIVEASGAAVKASMFVKDHKIEVKKDEVEPVDVSGPPRIGVFICHCGPNISKVVDIEALLEYTKDLPDVVFCVDYEYACSDSAQRQIQQQISENNINRVVVAACTPKTHEQVFQDSMTRVGLNPYLLDFANIRNQCSWVHQSEPEMATEKAKELVRMSITRAKRLKPLYVKELPVGRDVAIIGAGVSGLKCGIELLERGHKVTIIEKNEKPGGLVKDLSSIYPSYKSGKSLTDTLIKDFNEAGGKILCPAKLKDIQGYVGNFNIKLDIEGKELDLTSGAIVLATGATLYEPRQRFGYDKFNNVITNMELEEKVSDDEIKDIKSVVIIQCVGSRDEQNPGCSRYCCQSAIKEAIQLKRQGYDVTILNRGIRVYSKGAERMYRKARELGVLFLPYKNEPKVKGKNKAEEVIVYSSDLDADIVIPADLVVLSAGMIPAQDSVQLSELFKVPLGSDNFFLERHSKFGPVETTVEGIFLCGCCQFPQDISDSISQGSAVASKVSALLSRDKITTSPITSEVDQFFCRACGSCVEICEFHAVEIVEKERGVFAAEVNEALCKGCGTCVPVCPTGAIDLKHFKSDQIEAQLEALFD